MGVGVVFRRFSNNTSDYFRAGGKATWWLLGGSMFMQSFSAWTFTGAAQDTAFLFEVGRRIADGDKWPEWRPGNEFKAKRDAMLKK